MSTIRTPLLVTVQWLRQQLAKPSSNLRVLDTTGSLLASGYPEFIEEHIPDSQHYDIHKCISPKPTIARNLPEFDCLTDYIRSLGINNDSHVVVYDKGSMTQSSKVWWTLKAFGHSHTSVLDGGFTQWVASAFPISRGTPDKREKGDFVTRLDTSIITKYEELVKAVKVGDTQIADARHPDHFNGTKPEPSKATINALKGMDQPIPETMHRGHIPGAVNILEEYFIDSNTNCFLTKDKIAEVFHVNGIDLTKPLTTMCYNGHSAALLSLMSAICEKHDTKVYYGSWTEWGQRAPSELVVRPADKAG